MCSGTYSPGRATGGSGNSGKACSIGSAIATIIGCGAAGGAAMIRTLMGLSELAQRLLAGDRRALARAISLVADDEPAGWQLVAEIYPHTGSAALVGVTGPPGAGKSTLIGALTARRRAAGRRVGVLSIDPTSPFTGGAVLGDRIRPAEHFFDRRRVIPLEG